MIKTWRWFGKKDLVTLDMLRQIGVEGVVTSLHNIPNGEIWPLSAIKETKQYIESFGLKWSVAESLPVAESIKYGGKDRDRLIENYKVSLANLGSAGISKVCYNFMPVIDWVRTDLSRRNVDGTFSLYFDKIKFIYFDCFILGRENAEADYSSEEMEQVRALHKTITEQEKADLIHIIIVKTQGFINGNISESDKDPVSVFRKLLALYDHVDKAQLRENLKYFLKNVVPVAEQSGVHLCIHPDDPPIPVFGLPRIVSTSEDIDWILNEVDSPYNGLTFCAGSLSASLQNDVTAMAQRFVKRSCFAHLRSTDVFDNGDFTEASHLNGRANLIDLIRIFEKENPGIPMRVDHGKLMLDDVYKLYNPGYSFLGRMYALAQVEGIMAAVRNELEKK